MTSPSLRETSPVGRGVLRGLAMRLSPLGRAFALLGGAMALLSSGCDCRPVAPTNWTDLQIECNGQGDFGRNSRRSDQIVIESRQQFEDFLRRDCLRGQASINVPAVDFTRRVVIVDATFSPLEDGTCVGSRRVAQVDACVGGVQILYDDAPDPECAARLLTGAISIDREDAKVAFSTEPAPAATF